MPFSATATAAGYHSDGGGAHAIPRIVAGLVERADARPAVPPPAQSRKSGWARLWLGSQSVSCCCQLELRLQTPRLQRPGRDQQLTPVDLLWPREGGWLGPCPEALSSLECWELGKGGGGRRSRGGVGMTPSSPPISQHASPLLGMHSGHFWTSRSLWKFFLTPGGAVLVQKNLHMCSF